MQQRPQLLTKLARPAVLTEMNSSLAISRLLPPAAAPITHQHAHAPTVTAQSAAGFRFAADLWMDCALGAGVSRA